MKNVKVTLLFLIVLVMGGAVSLLLVKAKNVGKQSDWPRRVEGAESGPPPAKAPVSPETTILEETVNSSNDDTSAGLAVPGSYTDEDLVAAVDDYFAIPQARQPLEPVDASLLARVRRAFNSEDISQIDAAIHAFIFDNGVTRGQKLAVLWQLVGEYTGYDAPQSYLLDTLGAFRPVELTQQLIQMYESCVSDECFRKTLLALTDGASLVRVGHDRLSPEQERYALSEAEHLNALITRELSAPRSADALKDVSLAALDLFGNEAALPMLDEVLARDAQALDGLLPAYADSILLRPSVPPELLSILVQRVSSAPAGPNFDRAVNAIYAALSDPDFSAENRALLKDFVAAREPHDASGSDYTDWLSAYAATFGPGEAVRNEVAKEKLLTADARARATIALDYTQLLKDLTPSQREDILRTLHAALAPLSPWDLERKLYESAIQAVRSIPR